MAKRVVVFLLLCTALLHAQSKDSINNSYYLEDQIYVGFSYILLNEATGGVSQKGFSNSLNFGFIKDIPVTEEGNFAFGIGLGYGRNTYFQNVRMYRSENVSQFELIADDFDFKTNKFSTHTFEIPIQIRWRTSTINKYKFWRIYTGGKLSYPFATNAKLKLENEKDRITGIDEINNLQFGLTMAVGYGTWNFNIYYGLTDLFSDAFLDTSKKLSMKDIRIGLIFYIL